MTILEHLRAHHCARRLAAASLLALCLLIVSEGQGVSSTRPTQTARDNNCVSCHSRTDSPTRQVVALHEKSSHGQVGCQACHGGEPASRDKKLAHSGTFVGKPDFSATLTMCAKCHESPLTQFKSGRHFKADRTTSKMDCVTCHGAHTIGTPPEGFSFVQFCAGCHGLEYLPQLPTTLRDLLVLGDDLRSAFREARAKGLDIPAEFNEDRKSIRRNVSQIVHPTNLKGASQQIPVIIERGQLLKQRMSRLNSKGER